jgi:hypothetical protein
MRMSVKISRTEERAGEQQKGDGGCAFVIDDPDPTARGVNFCGAPRELGSTYCRRHHALCRLPRRSLAERRQLREIEALAEAVGGRQGRGGRQPPPRLLRRLDRITRAISRPNRSLIVLESPMATRRTLGTETTSLQQESGPTPERRQHGGIERLDRAIGDADGHPSRPYRAIDTLAIMHRRGSITAGMRQAGEDFRARFAAAHLDPLRALDLSHLRVGEPGLRPEQDSPALRIEAARGAVWRAVQAAGGIASPAGSCLWHVLGWERSLKEWALERGWSGRRVSQEAASGILVAALGALEAHFGIAHALPNSHFYVDKSGSM